MPGPRPDPQPLRWVEHTVTAEEAGRTVGDVLTGPLRISRRMLQRLTRSGGIRLNRRPTFLARKLRAGDVVAARVADTEGSELPPVAMELDVRYEDAEVLVVNKPPGLLVHPVAPHHTRTLAHGIAHRFQQQGLLAKVRPVHRLDRDTSGLLLVAKTPVAQQRLDRQLQAGRMRRGYLALVDGVMEADEGVVDAPIARAEPRSPLRTVREAGGQPARTRWRVVRRLRDATLLELELETGRTHQIRVHMAHLGHPVLGDAQYGGRAVPGLERQALHAARLRFFQPTSGEEVVVEAPLPEDLERAVRGADAAAPPSPGG